MKLINSETTEKQLKPVIESLKQTDAIDRSIRVSEMYLKKLLNSSTNFLEDERERPSPPLQNILGNENSNQRDVDWFFCEIFCQKLIIIKK